MIYNVFTSVASLRPLDGMTGQGGRFHRTTQAKQLDGWTREFLAAHPDATVLHLGCGLDSWVFRIDPPAIVRWYDVDLPDVIELRRRLYPERHDY